MGRGEGAGRREAAEGIDVEPPTSEYAHNRIVFDVSGVTIGKILTPPAAPPTFPLLSPAVQNHGADLTCALDQRNAVPAGFLAGSVRHPLAKACHGSPEVIFSASRRRVSAMC